MKGILGVPGVLGVLAGVFAGFAAAQSDPPREPERPAERKGLNLQLDDAFLRSQPRAVFEERKGTGEASPAAGLPSLGGDASPSFSAPPASRSSTSSGPFPPDTELRR